MKVLARVRQFTAIGLLCLPASVIPTTAGVGADALPTSAEYRAICQARITKGEDVAENHCRIAECLRLELRGGESADHFMFAYEAHADPYFYFMNVLVRLPGLPEERSRLLMQMAYENDRRYWYYIVDRIDPEIDHLVLLLGDPVYSQSALSGLLAIDDDQRVIESLFMHIRNPRFHQPSSVTVGQLAACLVRRGGPAVKRAEEITAQCAREQQLLMDLVREDVLSGTPPQRAYEHVRSRVLYLSRLEATLNVIIHPPAPTGQRTSHAPLLRGLTAAPPIKANAARRSTPAHFRSERPGETSEDQP